MSKARNAKRPMPINLYTNLVQKADINNYLGNLELIEFILYQSESLGLSSTLMIMCFVPFSSI